MSLCLKDNRSSFSQVSLKPETKDVDWKVHKQLFCCVCKRHDFWKTKIWCQTTWRWTILCLMLNSWRWTNLWNIFGNWLLVPRILHLRYSRYATVIRPRTTIAFLGGFSEYLWAMHFCYQVYPFNVVVDMYSGR